MITIESKHDIHYPIPKNMGVKNYVFSGIGYWELAFIGMGIVVGWLVYKILGQFFTSWHIYAPVIVIPLVVGLLVKEDPRTGVSMVDLLKRKRKYDKSQKIYYYKW